MHCELTSSEASALSMLEAASGKFAKPFDLFIVDYDTPAGGGFALSRRTQHIIALPKIMMLLPMMGRFVKLNEHGIDIGVEANRTLNTLNGIQDIFNLKAVSGSNLQQTEIRTNKA